LADLDALEQLEKYSKESTAKENVLYNGLTFNEMCDILTKDTVKNDDIGRNDREELNEVKNIFGDKVISLLHILWMMRVSIISGSNSARMEDYGVCLNKLNGYGLIEYTRNRPHIPAKFTDQGRTFLMQLMKADKAKMAEDYKFNF
jgi:hypothetical protein